LHALVLRLHHVALPFPGTTESVTIARQFYGTVLGLEERPVPPSLPGVLWFAAGDQELHLFAEPSGVAANGESRRHPCFEVNDLAALRVLLDEAGIAVMQDGPGIPGRRRFFVRDPFGNAIEFVEFDVNHA
jgi:catechol 2,3-dioxygenase-like lactoylglutathione lyase family enzyme